MGQKRLLCIRYFLLLTIIIIISCFLIFIFYQKYYPPIDWYKDHINMIMSAQNEDCITRTLKNQSAIQTVKRIAPSTWSLVFYTLAPETTETLLISTQVLTTEKVKKFLLSNSLLSNVTIDEISLALFQGNTYKFTNNSTEANRRNGYLEYRMLDNNCLYCKMYNPT